MPKSEREQELKRAVRVFSSFMKERNIFAYFMS